MKLTISKYVIWCAALCLALTLASCGGKRNLAFLDSRQLYDEGKSLYDRGKYIKAIEYFQTIVYNFPGVSLVDTAQHFLAMSYFNNKDHELARVEFNRLAINYPSSDYFQHALFMKSASAFESTPNHYGLDQSELQDAISELEDFLIDFPESPHANEASYFLEQAKSRLAHKFYESGIVYMHLRAYEAATVYFQKVIDNYTNSEYAPDAMFKMALARFKQKKFEEAYQKFSNFPVVFPSNELVAEAQKYEQESAFRDARKDYEALEYISAKEKLLLFKQTYPQSKHNDDVDKYLQLIDAAGTDNPEKADAGS